MRNRIWHNYASLIHCLRAFHILCFAYLLFRCYCYNHYKTPKYYFCYRYLLPPLPLLSYYFATKYLAADIKFPGVVELTTQPLILDNIVGVLGTGVPRLACLRPAAWLKRGPARPVFIDANPRPSRGSKPRGADDTELPQARPHQAGSRGGGEIKAGYLTRCP